MRITALNWDIVDRAPSDGLPAHGTLWALWPSPVDHDECFHAAGFADFADTDETWTREFEGMVERAVSHLGRLGVGTLVTGEYPKKRWRTISQPLSAKPRLPLLSSALLAAALTDDFPRCEVAFGSPSQAVLRSSHGHPLLWLWKAEGDVMETLVTVADSRAILRVSLDWTQLSH